MDYSGSVNADGNIEMWYMLPRNTGSLQQESKHLGGTFKTGVKVMKIYKPICKLCGHYVKARCNNNSQYCCECVTAVGSSPSM